MQEEFIVFVQELFGRIAISFEILLEKLVAQLAQVPLEVIVALAIGSFILLFRVPFLRSLILLPYLLVRPLFRTFGFFSDTEPWSVVYDSKTKDPLDPVYVSIYDTLGTEVASAVTDLEGRFGVVLPRGTYTIMVQKTNYSFPSKRLQGKKSDGFRNQLYFGETITIVDNERTLALHIPMDSQGDDWNQQEKKRMGLFGIFRRRKIYGEGGIFFAVLGACITLAQYIANPSGMSQKIVISYGFLLFLHVGISIARDEVLHHSVILDRETGEPVSFARIKIFTKERKYQVAKRTTTLHGQFVCLLSPGTYYAIIEKRRGDGTYEEVHTTPSFTVQDGYIHKKFVV